MEIIKLYTEYQESPMGIDEEAPRFSWEMSSDEQNTFQSAYRIRVSADENSEIIWDSGKVISSRSSGIKYKGIPLQACTRYQVFLQVWDQSDREAEAKDWFETGLMNPDISAWEGAQWIAAPGYNVMARTRGVFCVTSDFRMAQGAVSAGIVFGEGDYRLLDGMLNEYGLAGENYIRYEVNLKNMDAPKLDIYRVGYAPGDDKEKPFASVLLKDAKTGKFLLNEENKEKFHTLSIRVTGNQAQAYFDNVLVDAGEQGRAGRTLNPRGMNDVLTYPRLNRIGFFAGKEGKVFFRNYTVSNLREPRGVFVEEKAGGSLYGRESIFKELLPVEQDCFVVKNGQVTADPSHTSIPMFRREFQIKSGLKSARLYITSRGIYDCMVNGVAINNNLLAPGLTQYDRRMNYQTYDITKLLQEGENGIGVILSSGWWSDAQTYTVSNYNYFGDREAFLCKLVLEYKDGQREALVSDTQNWLYYGDGPYEYGGFFLGEQYRGDKGQIAENFSKPGFDTGEWEHPIVYSPVPIAAVDMGFGRKWPAVNEKEPLLIGGYDAPVSVVEERTANSRLKRREDVFIYDFGQEMAGVPEITFHEKEGTKIFIQYGEMLYPDLPAYAGNAGKLMRENYRDAESTDVYICRGGTDGETYRPRFTFHGFRYLQLVGVYSAPELCEVRALQYSSIRDFQGSFHSDNELLNRFAENVKWSQLCNFINIPTDCPQRNERMGWAGDTHVFCNTALHNADLKLFYERNLTAMQDLQEENGRYPEIAPIGGGFGGITYECASLFIAWEVYQQYGDVRTLERFYPGMRKYMDYMKDKGMPGKGDEKAVGPLADWLAFQETDAWLMWNAFYYREAVLMEKIAGILNLTDEQEQYGLLQKEIRSFWNHTFVEKETGRTLTIDGRLCDTQCSYALALAYGVADDAERMAGHLARKVEENDYKVGTGFFGTGLLNKALSESGYREEAWKMLLQTEFPSWLYPVTQGATTIWEHWDSYTKERGFGEYNTMNSFNHYSLGSVLSWMYEEILGIQRQEEYPGYTHFLLKPDVNVLGFAHGSVASPLGKIESGFRREKGKILYFCRIPVNASATLILPGREEQELGSGYYEYEMVEEAQELLGKMTLEEKITMIHGNGLFETGAVERLSIPPLRMSDGPMGVRKEFHRDSWKPIGHNDDFVSYLPSNSAIAATWSRTLAYQCGKVLGEEARGRGKDVILAPGINIKRSPLCGRNFEYMSEDPYLTAGQCVPLIKGIQENDVAVCVKHFALNNQERNRLWVNVQVSERALREIYLPAFYAAVTEGEALTLMGAYNLVRGSRCCENSYLLDKILREEWGWQGVTISDWGGILRTKESAEVSMDIEMSIYADFDEYCFAKPLLEAVKKGEITETEIDKKVYRILMLMSALHMLDGNRKRGCYHTLEHHQVALDAARESIVLLKNEGSVLPLETEKLTRLLVVGQNADCLHSGGGGSAEVKALYEISPLMGLKSQLGGNTEVRFAEGYYVPEGGVQEDNWQEDSLRDREGTTAKEEILTEEILAKRQELLEEAVLLAKQYETVIFIGGLNHQYDLEDQDRRDMKLPYGQDELIEALLDANKNTIVVINAGSPVEMFRWERKARAILWNWYNGMEGGNALAEILLGKVNPSGRLPETFPFRYQDCSAHCVGEFGKKEEVQYREDIFVGYRYYDKNKVEVQYPFGHGLSYTDFRYGQLTAVQNNTERIEITVKCSIKNVGMRFGKEVVQLYVKAPGMVMECPEKELKGYEKIALDAGEEKEIVFLLTEAELAHYDERSHRMLVEAGEYEIMAGASSVDIRCRVRINIFPCEEHFGRC